MSDWVIRLIEQSGYLGVGFLLFLETVVPPFPSEVILPVAGMAAAVGKSRANRTKALPCSPNQCSARRTSDQLTVSHLP